MILDMYSIKDTLNGFTPPIPIQNEESAKRYMKDQVLGNVTLKNSHEQFSLWKMGTFDSESGPFIMNPTGVELVV